MQNQELSHEDIDQVFKNIEIPACPTIVSLAMSEAQRDEPDIRKLCAAIEQDVGMAALTIKLANSPLFRTNQPVSRVSDALARLGIRNVVCVVVAAALRSCMTGVDAKWLESFWSHASMVATAAGLIAKKQSGIPPDAAYTFALFHDSAIPLLRKKFENYAEVMQVATNNLQSVIDAERQNFTCTHPVVGSLLARNWGLPDLIGKSILFHHEEDIYLLPEKTVASASLALIAVTHVAERLVAKSLVNVALDVSDAHFEQALNHLSIDIEELDEIGEMLEKEG